MGTHGAIYFSLLTSSSFLRRCNLRDVIDRKNILDSDVKILQRVIDRALVACGYELLQSSCEVSDGQKDFELVLRFRLRDFRRTVH